MLLQVLERIKKEKRCTSEQLARMFNISHSAIEPMLSFWVRKGALIAHQQNTCGQTCRACYRQQIIIYEFLEEKN